MYLQKVRSKKAQRKKIFFAGILGSGSGTLLVPYMLVALHNNKLPCFKAIGFLCKRRMKRSAVTFWIADMQVKVIRDHKYHKYCLHYLFIFSSWELLLKIIFVFQWEFSCEICIFTVSSFLRENRRKRFREPPF
jgi:hypothetical protein